MPLKIKTFFVFLAFLAVISVFSFFDVVGGVKSALLPAVFTPLPPISNDFDNDGLSDTEESYWNTDFQNPDTDGDGFLDGEETASRNDPTIAGPNDRLEDLNLTQKVATITASGLVEGSLKPDSPTYADSMDSVALAVIDDGLGTFMSYPESFKLNTIEDSPENNEKYIKAAELVWEQFFKAFGDELSSIDAKLELTNSGGYSNPEFISYFVFKRAEFDSISKNWQGILVPAGWQKEHLDVLAMLQEITKINEALAKGKDDPVRASMGLMMLVNLTEQIPETIKIYSNKIKSLGISGELFN